MKITLDLHSAPPESDVAATQEFEDMVSYADCTIFLWNALERMAKGIKAGEVREIGIGVRIDG